MVLGRRIAPRRRLDFWHSSPARPSRLGRLRTIPIERVSSRAIPVKWKICGLYVHSYLARRSANAHGLKDGIMVDRDGPIAEASASNVFFIDDNKLVTPPLNEDVFPGITRQLIFAICRKLGITCTERNVFPADIGKMQAAFLCSTLSELKPVSWLDGNSYDSANHPTFRTIAGAYDALTAQYPFNGGCGKHR